MGSPLGLVLVDIFMIELENSLLPKLTKYTTFWKQYVDDTIYFVKIGTTEFIISILNTLIKIFNLRLKKKTMKQYNI